MEKLFDFFHKYHVIRAAFFIVPYVVVMVYLAVNKHHVKQVIIEVNNRELPNGMFDKILRFIGGEEYKYKELDKHLGEKINNLESLESELKRLTRIQIVISVLWVILFFIFYVRIIIFR